MDTTTAAKLICLARAAGMARRSQRGFLLWHSRRKRSRPRPTTHTTTGFPIAVGREIRVFDADREHVDLVRWAWRRFQRAGLELPPVAIHFHPDTVGCYGFLGYEQNGRVDICMVHVSEVARRVVLHELGHRWIDENVSGSVREQFLEQRNLRVWNELDVPWDARGYEQGTEIIAWGLGTRYLAPIIPDRDPPRLEAGFELLTGIGVPYLGNV